MKLNGEKPQPCEPVPVVFPRGNKTIVLMCGIVDFTEFEERVKRPTPPIKHLPQGVDVPDFTNKTYLAALDDYGKLKVCWMVLDSLRATEGLEWDTVELDLPETWSNYATELNEGGFSDNDIIRIVHTIQEANGLSAERIEEATKDFLAGKLRPGLNGSSLTVEPTNT